MGIAHSELPTKNSVVYIVVASSLPPNTNSTFGILYKTPKYQPIASLITDVIVVADETCCFHDARHVFDAFDVTRQLFIVHVSSTVRTVKRRNAIIFPGKLILFRPTIGETIVGGGVGVCTITFLFFTNPCNRYFDDTPPIGVREFVFSGPSVVVRSVYFESETVDGFDYTASFTYDSYRCADRHP